MPCGSNVDPTPVSVNLALVCPAGTVTVPGPLNLLVSELLSVTTRPPCGAGESN
jgi:hypothetical protein